MSLNIPSDWPTLTLPEKLELLRGIKGRLVELKRNPERHLADYKGDPVGFIQRGLGQAREPSWNGWMIVIKAAFGQPLTIKELEFFHEIAGGRPSPNRPVRELWCIVGRRGGKDSVASLIATYLSRFADTTRLRLGEEGITACLATDRNQAEIVWKYCRGYFEAKPELYAFLRSKSMTNNRIQLLNKVEIRIATNNYRAPRGRAIVAGILDEVAFYRDEESANPDVDTYMALRPGMLMMPGSMIIGISSPHRQKGLLFQKFEEHFGQDSDDVLVIKAPTRLMNPLIDVLEPGLIDKAMEEDPDRAAAEYGAEFRRDLADYVSRDVVYASVQRGIREIPYDVMLKGRYVGFVDPSGGSRDSFTMAVAHLDEASGQGILDFVKETRPPFAPSEVAADFAREFERYNVYKIQGDRYAAQWPVEQFAINGVIYEQSEIVKSDLYRDFLPALNSRRVRLLDNTRLINQLLGLERRTVRGGRDSIDHVPGANDDVINAAVGALLQVVGDDRLVTVSKYLRAFAS
jgi:hypothetical protein